MRAAGVFLSMIWCRRLPGPRSPYAPGVCLRARPRRRFGERARRAVDTPCERNPADAEGTDTFHDGDWCRRWVYRIRIADSARSSLAVRVASRPFALGAVTGREVTGRRVVCSGRAVLLGGRAGGGVSDAGGGCARGPGSRLD